MELTIDGQTFSFDDADPALPSWERVYNEIGGTFGFRNDGLGMAVVYVKSPSGAYNQILFYNRGGSVIAVTKTVNGVVHFLTLSQVRASIGSEPIYELPRGQAKKKEDGTIESAVETAIRELVEETGLGINHDQVTYLGAGNPDSAVILGATVHCVWVELADEYVDLIDDKPVLKPGVVGESKSRVAEQIRKAEFVEEGDLKSPSMMTAWATGLVLQRIRVMERSRATSEATA